MRSFPGSRRFPRNGAARCWRRAGLVHVLVEDTSARYSRTGWDISAALSATVGEIEAAGHGTLAGTVHTHPAGVPDPSCTDIATTRDALGLNPHLDEQLIAIVTDGTPREHDLPVGSRHRIVPARAAPEPHRAAVPGPGPGHGGPPHG